MPTRRRRFRWAAWWREPPVAEPFRPPDAETGGARTREEAHAQAESAAGQRLREIDGRWCGAWVRIQRGEKPWPGEPPSGIFPPPPSQGPPQGSRAWALALLGVSAEAGPDAIKKAFHALALRTHPDHGGSEAAFIEAKRARTVALRAARRDQGT